MGVSGKHYRYWRLRSHLASACVRSVVFLENIKKDRCGRPRLFSLSGLDSKLVTTPQDNAWHFHLFVLYSQSCRPVEGNGQGFGSPRSKPHPLYTHDNDCAHFGSLSPTGRNRTLGLQYWQRSAPRSVVRTTTPFPEKCSAAPHDRQTRPKIRRAVVSVSRVKTSLLVDRSLTARQYSSHLIYMANKQLVEKQIQLPPTCTLHHFFLIVNTSLP